jgi:hypothetical protein
MRSRLVLSEGPVYCSSPVLSLRQLELGLKTLMKSWNVFRELAQKLVQREALPLNSSRPRRPAVYSVLY